mgnify:CR=1 FL=1
MLRPNSVPEQISGSGVTVLIGFVALLKRVSIVFLLLQPPLFLSYTTSA